MKQVLVVCVAGLAACAPTTMTPTVSGTARELEQQKQYELALEDLKEHTERAFRIYTRIARANADSCPQVKEQLGLYVQSKEMFKSAERTAAIKVYNLLEDHPVVVSSTHEAIQPGDFIRKIEGKPVSTYAEMVQIVGSGNGPVQMTISRAGKEHEVTIPRTRQCAYPLRVVGQSMVNAFATGSEIIFTSGMVAFARTDDELAIVMGHELAHNVEGHVDKQKGNYLAGALIGAVLGGLTGVNMAGTFGNMGAMAFSQEFEAEADYVGIYYAAKAGYDIKEAPKFWRRMAVQNPKAIAHGTTHPDTASRFLALEKAVEEIEAKRVAGKPLIPERRVVQAHTPEPTGPMTPEQQAAYKRKQDCLAAHSAMPRRCDQY